MFYSDHKAEILRGGQIARRIAPAALLRYRLIIGRGIRWYQELHLEQSSFRNRPQAYRHHLDIEDTKHAHQ